MLIQAQAAAPPLPWWVLYLVLLGAGWGVYRLTVRHGWLGLLVAIPGLLVLFVFSALTLPVSRVGLILLLSLAPVLAFMGGMVVRRRAMPATLPHDPLRGGALLPPEVMHGQPRIGAVMRGAVMNGRYAAGLPRDASWVARLHYESGLPELQPRQVDIFVGGGQLWIAPLAAGGPLPSLELRDVLRVDLWPEPDGSPPTLRITWSPPAGELTRELVLSANPAVPAADVQPQMQAIASALKAQVDADARADVTAPAGSSDLAGFDPRRCPACGTELPADAPACRFCGTPADGGGGR